MKIFENKKYNFFLITYRHAYATPSPATKYHQKRTLSLGLLQSTEHLLYGSLFY